MVSYFGNAIFGTISFNNISIGSQKYVPMEAHAEKSSSGILLNFWAKLGHMRKLEII